MHTPPAMASIPGRFKAAKLLYFSFDSVASLELNERFLVHHLKRLPAGYLTNMTEVNDAHRSDPDMTLRTAAELARVCPNLQTFGTYMIIVPSIHTISADLKQLLSLRSITELYVRQAASATTLSPGAAAAGSGGGGGGSNGGGSGGGDSTTNATSVDWLAQLPTLQRLGFEGAGREVLVSALPFLTCLTYLQVHMVGEQEQEAPRPLASCPALRELSFSGYFVLDRAVSHLGSCGPLTGLTRLELSNK